MEKDQGEEVYWYETTGIDKKTKGNYSYYIPKPEMVNQRQYKLWLLNTLKDILEITGFNIKSIELEIVEGMKPLV